MTDDRNPIRRGDDGRIRHIDVPKLMQTPDGFAQLRAAFDELARSLPDTIPTETPPWLLAPGTTRDCLLWKVKRGPEVLRRFITWYRSQGPDLRRRFRETHPEPQGWTGFYASLT